MYFGRGIEASEQSAPYAGYTSSIFRYSVDVLGGSLPDVGIMNLHDAMFGARGGTAIRSRVRFPIVYLEFFVELILPAALWPWG